MDDTEYSLEKWNMAVAYHKRLNDLLTMCQLYRMAKDANRWYDAIIGVYMELQAKMKKEEIELCEKLWDLLKMEVHKKKTNQKVDVTPFLEFEMYLRQFMEKKNMLTPKGDDPTMAYRMG